MKGDTPKERRLRGQLGRAYVQIGELLSDNAALVANAKEHDAYVENVTEVFAAKERIRVAEAERFRVAERNYQGTIARLDAALAQHFFLLAEYARASGPAKGTK